MVFKPPTGNPSATNLVSQYLAQKAAASGRKYHFGTAPPPGAVPPPILPAPAPVPEPVSNLDSASLGFGSLGAVGGGILASALGAPLALGIGSGLALGAVAPSIYDYFTRPDTNEPPPSLYSPEVLQNPALAPDFNIGTDLGYTYSGKSIFGEKPKILGWNGDTPIFEPSSNENKDWRGKLSDWAISQAWKGKLRNEKQAFENPLREATVGLVGKTAKNFIGDVALGAATLPERLRGVASRTAAMPSLLGQPYGFLLGQNPEWAPNEKEGKGLLMELLRTLAPESQLVEQIYGAARGMVSTKQPSSQEKALDFALAGLSLSAGQRANEVSKFRVSGKWPTELVSEPNLMDYVGSHISYHVNNGEKTFAGLPVGEQMAAYVALPFAAESLLPKIIPKIGKMESKLRPSLSLLQDWSNIKKGIERTEETQRQFMLQFTNLKTPLSTHVDNIQDAVLRGDWIHPDTTNQNVRRYLVSKGMSTFDLDNTSKARAAIEHGLEPILTTFFRFGDTSNFGQILDGLIDIQDYGVGGFKTTPNEAQTKALKMFQDMRMLDEPISEEMAKLSGLPVGTISNPLNSTNGLLGRQIIKNILAAVNPKPAVKLEVRPAAKLVKRQMLLELLETIKSNNPEELALTKKINLEDVLKTREQAQKKLVDWAVKATLEQQFDVKDVPKYLEKSDWKKWQAFFSRMYHIGPVPGVGVRNVLSDITKLWLQDRKLLQENNSAFLQYYNDGGKLFAATRGPAGLRTIATRGYEQQLPESSKPYKILLEGGTYVMQGTEAYLNDSIVSSTLKIVFDKYRQSKITDVSMLANMEPEIVKNIVSSVKNVMRPDDLQNLQEQWILAPQSWFLDNRYVTALANLLSDEVAFEIGPRYQTFFKQSKGDPKKIQEWIKKEIIRVQKKANSVLVNVTEPAFVPTKPVDDYVIPAEVLPQLKQRTEEFTNIDEALLYAAQNPEEDVSKQIVTHLQTEYAWSTEHVNKQMSKVKYYHDRGGGLPGTIVKHPRVVEDMPALFRDGVENTEAQAAYQQGREFFESVTQQISYLYDRAARQDKVYDLTQFTMGANGDKPAMPFTQYLDEILTDTSQFKKLFGKDNYKSVPAANMFLLKEEISRVMKSYSQQSGKLVSNICSDLEYNIVNYMKEVTEQVSESIGKDLFYKIKQHYYGVRTEALGDYAWNHYQIINAIEGTNGAPIIAPRQPATAKFIDDTRTIAAQVKKAVDALPPKAPSKGLLPTPEFKYIKDPVAKASRIKRYQAGIESIRLDPKSISIAEIDAVRAFPNSDNITRRDAILLLTNLGVTDYKAQMILTAVPQQKVDSARKLLTQTNTAKISLRDIGEILEAAADEIIASNVKTVSRNADSLQEIRTAVRTGIPKQFINSKYILVTQDNVQRFGKIEEWIDANTVNLIMEPTHQAMPVEKLQFTRDKRNKWEVVNLQQFTEMLGRSKKDNLGFITEKEFEAAKTNLAQQQLVKNYRAKKTTAKIATPTVAEDATGSQVPPAQPKNRWSGRQQITFKNDPSDPRSLDEQYLDALFPGNSNYTDLTADELNEVLSLRPELRGRHVYKKLGNLEEEFAKLNEATTIKDNIADFYKGKRKNSKSLKGPWTEEVVALPYKGSKKQKYEQFWFFVTDNDYEPNDYVAEFYFVNTALDFTVANSDKLSDRLEGAAKVMVRTTSLATLDDTAKTFDFKNSKELQNAAFQFYRTRNQLQIYGSKDEIEKAISALEESFVDELSEFRIKKVDALGIVETEEQATARIKSVYDKSIDMLKRAEEAAGAQNIKPNAEGMVGNLPESKNVLKRVDGVIDVQKSLNVAPSTEQAQAFDDNYRAYNFYKQKRDEIIDLFNKRQPIPMNKYDELNKLYDDELELKQLKKSNNQFDWPELPELEDYKTAQGTYFYDGPLASKVEIVKLKKRSSVKAGEEIFQKLIPETEADQVASDELLQELYDADAKIRNITPVVEPESFNPNKQQSLNLTQAGKEKLTAPASLKALQDLYTAVTETQTNPVVRSVDPNNQAHVNSLTDFFAKAMRELNMTRAVAERVAATTVDNYIFNYGEKYNFDHIAEAIFGYPHWYLRTFSDYPRQILSDPNYLSKLFAWNQSINSINRDDTNLPLWMRGSVPLNVEKFGLKDILGVDTIYLPLLAQLSPLESLLNGDFTNATREKSNLGSAYNKLYGWGPGPHALVPLAIGTGLWYLGKTMTNPEYINQAEQYFGYLGSQTRLLSTITAQLEESGIALPLISGGVALDAPLLLLSMLGSFGAPTTQLYLRALMGASSLAQWSVTHAFTKDGVKFIGTVYDQRRVANILVEWGQEPGKIVNGIEITPDILQDAAIVSRDPTTLGSRKEYASAYSVWSAAVTESRTQKLLPQLFSYFGGPGVSARGSNEILQEQMYNKVDKLYDMRDDPNVSKEEYERQWLSFSIQFPDFPVYSMFKKYGEDAFQVYAYSALSRVGRGASARAIYDTVGLDYNIVDGFFDRKGKFEYGTDQSQFKEGIVRLALILQSPDMSTKQEWGDAANLYHTLQREMENMFPGTTVLQDVYFDLEKIDRPQYLLDHLDLKTRMDTELSVMIKDPRYKDKMAPYYVSIKDAEDFLKMSYMSKDPKRAAAYAIYLENYNDWSAKKSKQFLADFDLFEFHRGYKKVTAGMDNSIAALLKGISMPVLPKTRTDAAELESRKTIVQAIETLASKNLKNYNKINAEAASGATGNVADAGGGKLLQLIRDKANGTTTQNSAGRDLLANWEYLYSETNAPVINYVQELEDQLKFKTLQPLLEAYNGDSQAFLNALNVPLLSGRWSTFQDPLKWEESLVNYVKILGGENLRSSMMLEASRGVPFDPKQMVWSKVIGTVKALSDAEIGMYMAKHPELRDLNKVKQEALRHQGPTLNSLMDIVGASISIQEDGSINVSGQSVKKTGASRGGGGGSGGDLSEYISKWAQIYYGENIEELYDEYLMVTVSQGEQAGRLFWKKYPKLAQYQAFSNKLRDRYNDAKSGQFSSEKEIEKIVKSVNLMMSSTKQKAVGDGNQNTFSIMADIIKNQGLYLPKSPSGSRKAPDGRLFANLIAVIKARNPQLAIQFEEFIQANPIKRKALLQANPDLSRYITLFTPEQLGDVEYSYDAGLRIGGDSTSRGGGVRVYSQRSGRTGL